MKETKFVIDNNIFKVDLVVVGSVAVDRRNGRRHCVILSSTCVAQVHDISITRADFISESLIAISFIPK